MEVHEIVISCALIAVGVFIGLIIGLSCADSNWQRQALAHKAGSIVVNNQTDGTVFLWNDQLLPTKDAK